MRIRNFEIKISFQHKEVLASRDRTYKTKFFESAYKISPRDRLKHTAEETDD